NGVYHCYFEYVIDDSNIGLLIDSNDPHIWFNAKANDAANNQILLDNVVLGKVTNAKYAKTPINTMTFEEGSLPTMATNWGTRKLATEGAIEGNGSLSISSDVAGYPQLNCAMMTATAQKGRYYVEFDVKPIVGVYSLAVPVFGNYGGNKDYCIAELGLVFTWDGATLTNVEIGVSGGWKDSGYENASVTAKGNGVYHCYFEYVIDDSNIGLLINSNDPHIWFNARATDAANNEILLDNIVFGSLSAVPSVNYYTIDWDVDFEQYELGSTAYGSQPIWGNSATIVDDWFDTKCLSLGGATTAYPYGDTIGGFESRADEEHLGIKFLKGVGKNYVQMDIGQDNCSMINIWTQGYHTEVKFNGTNWHSEGNVRNFKAVEIESGYRISYYIDLPADQFALEFKINAAGDNGVVYIDNLKVVREDYAPFAQSQATYDLVDTKDVEIAVDLKGQEFVSLTSGGEAVEASKYTLSDGKLTLDKSLFGTEAAYTFVLTSTAGSTQIVVAQNDNRTEATVSCGAISKEYDGTTAVSNAILTLGGIADGDEVTVSYSSVAFDVANVTASKVVFEGIALGGKDAGKYVLAQTTLEVSATITKKQLTVTEPTVATTKVYDGTNAATLQLGTVSGIVDGDSVTLNAVATFDKADVTASKIAVTYTLEGADAQNYVAPANEEISGATITKKQLSAEPTVSKTKVYDGTNAATLQLGTVSGIVDGDSVT
ncbi:MAG: YDG domain-containing protein, partial [Candidatus Fimimonas sp.]